MSSTYHVLCLSHDPAIILEPEFSLERALAAAANPAGYIGIAHHADCDLLVGRWSGGLMAIACPIRPHPGEETGGHSTPQSVEVAWLRLLSAAHRMELPDADLSVAMQRLPGCWSPTRIYRLRELLEPAPASAPIFVGASA